MTKWCPQGRFLGLESSAPSASGGIGTRHSGNGAPFTNPCTWCRLTPRLACATLALGAGAANEDTANARVTLTIAKLLFITEYLLEPFKGMGSHSDHTDSLNGKSELGLRVQPLGAGASNAGYGECENYAYYIAKLLFITEYVQ